MNNLLFLTKGEWMRLNKYKVSMVNMMVALIWFLILFFIEDTSILSGMLPFILMVDATMMSIIFIGAIMFFEKSEQTISTLLVTPTSYHAHIWAKTLANTMQMFVSSFVIVLIFYFVRQIDVNFVYLVFVLWIGIISHSLLGFVFSYHAKDFTAMLLMVMMYSFIFAIPTALYQFGIIEGEIIKYILMVSPTQAISYMFEAALSNSFALSIEAIISTLILISLTVFGYIFYVYPKYKSYAVKQSGV